MYNYLCFELHICLFALPTNGERTVAAVLVLFAQVVMVTDSFTSFPSLCRSDGVMRTMSTEKLLKTVPIIQNQMDVLLDFNVSFLCFLSFPPL